MTEYRASFDAAVSFSNGGDLSAHGFRVDLPSPDAGGAEIAALFLASLGLLMTDSVQLSNVQIFAEPYKGTRGAPPITTRAQRRRPGGSSSSAMSSGPVWSPTPGCPRQPSPPT